MINKRILAILTAIFILTGNIISESPTNDDTGDPNWGSDWSVIFPLPTPKNGSTRDVIGPSPKVASLGIFGQVPVGNYTGTATIDVPLHTISYKELSIPIYLKYNTLGNKPDIFPGHVGLGWALQAGGMIARTINGIVDSGDSTKCFFPCYPDSRNKENWYDVYSDYGLDIQWADLYVGGGKNEVDPDEFSYNINGQTGSFYFNYNDTILVQSNQGEFFHVIWHKRRKFTGTHNYDQYPERYNLFPDGVPCTISTNYAAWWANFFGENSHKYTNRLDSIVIRNYINGFTMIDSKGIKYVFGNGNQEKINDNAIEFTRLGHNGFSWDSYIESQDPLNWGNYINATAWHLTSIESPYGYKIELDYDREAYITKFRFTDVSLFKSSSGFFFSKNSQHDDGIRSVLTNGSVLKSIVFPDGKAIFTSTQASEQLDYNEPTAGLDPKITATSYNQKKHLNRFYYYPDIRIANTDKIRNSPYGNFFGCDDRRNIYFPQKLDKIVVYDKQDNPIRTVDFNYTHSRDTRLKLLSVSISGQTNTDKSSFKYSFEYDEQKLPPYLMNMTDYYGFYNGKQLFQEIYDAHPNADIWELLFGEDYQYSTNAYGNYYSSYFDEKKLPDFDYARAEILTKIIYPTGGYSLLEYEPHDFDKVYYTWPFGTESIGEPDDPTTPHRNDAGGLRIQSVNNYDNNDNPIRTKKYVYKNAYGKSSGVLAYKPVYVNEYVAVSNVFYSGKSGKDEEDDISKYAISADMILSPQQIQSLETLIDDFISRMNPPVDDQEDENKGYWDDPEEQAPINGFYRVGTIRERNSFDYFFRFTSNPVHPMSTTQGNHVTYSEVKVIDGDSEGDNGYTIFKYKNYDNNFADRPLKGWICNELEIWNVLPLSSKRYWRNAEGISMKLERGQPILTEVFDKTGTKVKSTEYLYNNDPKRFDEKVRYIRKVRNDINLSGSQNIMLLAGVHYTYHPYLREKQETLYFGSNNVQVNTKYTYNDEYRLLKTTEIIDSRGDVLKNEIFYPFEKTENIYKTMTDSFMIAYPTGSVSKRDNDIIAQSETKYSTELALDKPNMILPHQEYFSVKGANPELISTYNKYDKIGNPLSITDYKSGDKVCYLWSYNGSYPVAKIAGFDYEQVKTILTENVINTLWENANPSPEEIETIRNTLSNAGALVSTYRYIPLVGRIAETDFRGITTYYEYDGLGRLKEIKAGKKEAPSQNTDTIRVESYKYHYQTSLVKIFSCIYANNTVTVTYSGCSNFITSVEIIYTALKYAPNSGNLFVDCTGTSSFNIPTDIEDYIITVKLTDNKGFVFEDSIYLLLDPFIYEYDQ